MSAVTCFPDSRMVTRRYPALEVWLKFASGRRAGRLTSRYLSMDHRGTVSAVTDASQSTQLAYTVDSFGRQLAGIGGSNPNVPNSLIYQTNWLTLQVGGEWLRSLPK